MEIQIGVDGIIGYAVEKKINWFPILYHIKIIPSSPMRNVSADLSRYTNPPLMDHHLPSIMELKVTSLWLSNLCQLPK